jgi:hypothetical protein
LQFENKATETTVESTKKEIKTVESKTTCTDDNSDKAEPKYKLEDSELYQLLKLHYFNFDTCAR